MSSDPTSLYSRKNPFPGRLLTNRRLSKEGSSKDIRHYEIDLHGSGLTFEVGDSLGVYPDNDHALVEEMLTALGASGDEEVLSDKDGPVVPLAAGVVEELHHHDAVEAVPRIHRRAYGGRIRHPRDDGRPVAQGRSRQIHVRHGGHRLPAGASVDQVHGGGVHRHAAEVAATAVFHFVEPTAAPGRRCI